MTELIPESIKDLPNVTSGEQRLFDIFKNHLKPDEDYTVWFEPKLSNNKGKTLFPDFIIWGNKTGLIILEVKDWVASQIVDGDINKIKLSKGNKIEEYTNPEIQARNYMHASMDSLRKKSSLVSHKGKHMGQLKFPFNYGVVFTNITREEFDIKLSSIITPGKVLTADNIFQIENGKLEILDSFLKKMPLFPFNPLSGEEIDLIRAELYPRIKIPSGNDPNSSDIKVLDKNQEKEAMKLGPGHRIIKGSAGSGKTLLIAYRAKLLKQFNPDWKILIVCYNVTLRSYIKYLLEKIYSESNTETTDIEVLHLHELVINTIRSLPDPNQYNPLYPNPNEDWDSYQRRLEKVLMQNINNIPAEKYDAILIDECQDLTTDYLRFLIHLLNKKTNHLLITVDPAQNLYGGKITWKSTGVDAIGRVSFLQQSYRNTKEILEFAHKFRPEGIGKLTIDDTQQALFPEQTNRHGEIPVVEKYENDSDIVSYIINTITGIRNKYNLNEIGIIFQSNKFSYYNLLKTSLSENGFDFEEIDSREDKLGFDIHKETIKLMNIYNVKGYEFRLVFLLNLENISFRTNEMRNLIYVGLTRAQDKLIIPYVANGRHMNYIEELKGFLK